MTAKKQQRKTKNILVRVIPQVYEDAQTYGINVAMVMRRALVTELAILKAKLGTQGTQTTSMYWKNYDDKTMSFRNSEKT